MTIGSLQPLPLWLIQSVTCVMVHVDQVGQAVAVDVAEQDAAVGRSRKANRGLLRMLHALAPVAVAEVGPVLDVAVVDQDDVLQARRRSCRAKRTRGSEKLTLGKSSSAWRSTQRVSPQPSDRDR